MASPKKRGPVGTGDVARYCAQRLVVPSGIGEAFALHCDGVRAAVPFAHQPRARSDLLSALCGCLRIRAFRLHERGQFAAGRLAEPAKAKFLNAIGDGTNEQVSAETWRLAAIESPPLLPQLVRTKVGKNRKPSLHIQVATCARRCFALWQNSFFHGG
jgi:hypothetical protein